MFDAGHIPGAAMILFEGYMGTILFTGDFRFHRGMITDNSILFPRNGKFLEGETLRSIHIDEMIFDNTYCNEMFDFGTEDTVFKRMVEIIHENKHKKCLIAMGALGKEKLLLRISQHFQSLICVSQEKYRQIGIAKGPLHILTINPS
jgi:DNA cross-link repair 1B protein